MRLVSDMTNRGTMTRSWRRCLVVVLYAGITALLGLTFATGGRSPRW